jgi:hypothetical protein
MSELGEALIDAAAQEIVFENPFDYPDESSEPTDGECRLARRALAGAFEELGRQGYRLAKGSFSVDWPHCSALASEFEAGS